MAHEKASHGPREETLEKYSVFSTAHKWCIVAMVSYAAWFSTLTSFIYYSAIPQLAQAFTVSVDKINLTITSYMAVATTDVCACVESLHRSQCRHRIVKQLCSARGATDTTNSGSFWQVTMSSLFRFGSPLLGTFSFAYGVITDVASPAERGTFVSAVSFA
ncbi:MAG: hypothetical protein LQ339_003418 [Xanthoria mediterranea]|nr:MAG: hypothetical protein LQ339_003418 [Xanthoria mediterranea]